MRRFLQVAALLAVLLCLRGSTSEAQPDSTRPLKADQSTLDVTPIRDLLHLIGTILVENPGYQTKTGVLTGVDARAREDSLATWSASNASDPRISSEVERLLASPAYQLCFRQFTVTNPDWFRKFFFGLPYQAVDGPSGVGGILLELCRHYQEVSSWYESVISHVDPEACVSVARSWLPDGDYAPPTTYIIYGNGGDAFAREGKVCFDLYGVVLVKRPSDTRFENLSAVGTREIERVLAHEFHHIYAYSFLEASSPAQVAWQERWQQKIRRRIVSEGVAMQCNPPEGFNREVKEDTGVVRGWIGVLNRLTAGMADGRATEEKVASWWDNVDNDGATFRLKEYLGRRYPGSNLDSLVTDHNIDRPMFAYTLGWWMVTRISDGGRNRNRVIQLLSQPDSIFAWYNAAAQTQDSTLLITVGAK